MSIMQFIELSAQLLARGAFLRDDDNDDHDDAASSTPLALCGADGSGVGGTAAGGSQPRRGGRIHFGVAQGDPAPRKGPTRKPSRHFLRAKSKVRMMHQMPQRGFLRSGANCFDAAIVAISVIEPMLGVMTNERKILGVDFLGRTLFLQPLRLLVRLGGLRHIVTTLANLLPRVAQAKSHPHHLPLRSALTFSGDQSRSTGAAGLLLVPRCLYRAGRRADGRSPRYLPAQSQRQCYC